jgi:hypothetical protein
MALLPEMLSRVHRAWVFDNSVRAADATAFAGRLVARIKGGVDGAIVVRTRSLLPMWVAENLIEPARKRNWKIEAVDDNGPL